MPEYKLTYFNARGRAEIARLLFVLADVKYTDNRVERGDFPALKESLPTGQIPTLEVEGKSVVLTQSMAIARYLAQQFNLAGADLYEQAQANAVVDTLNEMIESYVNRVMHAPDAEKAAAADNFKTELAPKHLAKIEKIIAAYGSADQKFCVGSSLTWADVAVYSFIWTMPHVCEHFPRIRAVYKNVEANERIAQWVKDRPVTEM